MREKTILVIFMVSWLSIHGNNSAAQVKISGKAQDYASCSIDAYTIHNPITDERVKLGTFIFNAEGAFSMTANIDEPRLCLADFDGYQGMLYLEPGKSYNIIFPPKRNLTEAQKRNPFAVTEAIWFGISNSDHNDLNIRIQQFEQEYAKLENIYFDQIFINQSKHLADTIKTLLDKQFPKTEHSLFEAHKFFRKANIDFALTQGKTSWFMKTYFSNVSPKYNLAAYSVIFNQVFSNYFSQLNSTEVNGYIRSADLQKLDNYFCNQLNFNKELSHLALLKSLHDAYYSKQYDRATILKLLGLVKQLGWSSYEQKTAQLITSKLVYLSSGTVPPAISLKTSNGQKISISSYLGTYIYLHFTDPTNPICRQHLDALKTIADRYKGKLTIINVTTEGKEFKNNGWAGIFATTADNIEASYKIKTFPNSFLIGKDGRLLLSPAPNPIDGFDRQMGQILKSDYVKEIQKTGNQSIK